MKSSQISPGAGHLKTQHETGLVITPCNVCCKSSSKNARTSFNFIPLFNPPCTVLCKGTNKRHVGEFSSEIRCKARRLKQITAVHFFSDKKVFYSPILLVLFSQVEKLGVGALVVLIT